MPIITTNIVGKGTEDDWFRADFPTYTIAAWDFDHARMIVHVPDVDLPTHITNDDQLHAHLDQRYKERAGMHRPRVYARG